METIQKGSDDEKESAVGSKDDDGINEAKEGADAVASRGMKE